MATHGQTIYHRRTSLEAHWPTALTSDVMLADPKVHHAPVDYNIVCSNQLDPNIDWGSNISNSLFSIKMHHRESFNITRSSILFVHHGDAAEPIFEVNPYSADMIPKPYDNVFAPESNSEASSSGVI
ncbi:hypothetical protein Tco_0701326 [Tanacetum coccineum]